MRDVQESDWNFEDRRKKSEWKEIPNFISIIYAHFKQVLVLILPSG
jgi:hypothetical protein